MQERRDSPAVVASDQFIFIFGGYDNVAGNFLKSCESFDPLHNQ